MEKWNKHTYVCSTCDGLVEMTIKSNNEVNDDNCPVCEIRSLILLSVVDATISPITEKKEETNMETLTPAQTMTLTWQNNGVDETTTYTENDVRSAIYNNKRLNEKMNEYYRKESQLRNLLEEAFADSQDQEVLEQIADIFDVPLTKEIEVTTWIRVSSTIEVDIREGEYDLEDLMRNNLTVDSFGSEISVNDYEVERVEEGLY